MTDQLTAVPARAGVFPQKLARLRQAALTNARCGGDVGRRRFSVVAALLARQRL